MFEHRMFAGRDPIIVDGVIYLTEDKERGIVWEGQEGHQKLVKVEETDDEWLDRMMEDDLGE